jgi:hypothetical protein
MTTSPAGPSGPLNRSKKKKKFEMLKKKNMRRIEEDKKVAGLESAVRDFVGMLF